ncbi:MAG TPA: hypothetical protein VGB26_12820 [Nitrospiria bacterium]|jgi:hypothetical protein
MSEDIQQSIEDVTKAIDRLNQAFERRTEELRQKGNHEEFNQWVQAKAAMRDSGVIYLSWARHYAKSAKQGGTDEMNDDDLFEFPTA